MPDSAPTESKPFDWRDSITISPRFSAEERNQLEDALERIARVPEGAELLKAAIARAGGKLGIWQPEGSATSADFNKGVINIDFEELAQYGYNTPNGLVRPSITGVLVHELSHLSQDPLSPEQLAQAITGAVDEKARAANVTDPQRTVNELAAVMARSSNAEILTKLSLENPQRQEVIEELRANRLPNAAEWFEKVPPQALNESLQAQGILNAANELVTEINAVNYTDRFMEKYFIGEPQRGTPSNFVFVGESAALPPTQIKERTASPATDIKSMATDPMSRSLAGFDLTALRQCSPDVSDLCRGDTGALAVANVHNDKSPAPTIGIP